jgi:hypothetical protein
MEKSDLRTWNSKTLIECDPKTILTTIQNCLVIYYGMHIANIPDVLLTEACKQVLKQFPTLTIEEVKHSYERLPLERKVTVMIDDVLKPISRYHNTKISIYTTLRKIQSEITYKNQQDREFKEFQQESLRIYRVSLPLGEFQGDYFNAHAIAKDFLSDRFEKSFRDSLWEQAKARHYEITQNEDDLYKNLGMTPERLYSLLIVKEAIKRTIKL